MDGVGWEIRPVGWFLLLIVVALLAYCIVKWLLHLRTRTRKKLS